MQAAIGSGFASHCLKKRGEILQPLNKRSNSNRVIAFDSHLKTAIFYDLILANNVFYCNVT